MILGKMFTLQHHSLLVQSHFRFSILFLLVVLFCKYVILCTAELLNHCVYLLIMLYLIQNGLIRTLFYFILALRCKCTTLFSPAFFLNTCYFACSDGSISGNDVTNQLFNAFVLKIEIYFTR